MVGREKLSDLVIGDLVINPPIMQGGMGVRVSTASLASAVSNTGAFGVIASVGLVREDIPEKEYDSGSAEALRIEIRKAKQLTKQPFGTNIMCALTNYDSLAKVSSEENVGAIISGAGLPLHLPSLVGESTTKLIPIVSSARATAIILRAWDKRYKRIPDAIVVEGPLAGGHLGFSYSEAVGIGKILLEDIVKDVLNTVKEYEASYNKKIPVIAAGGIFDGIGIAEMLKLGASGVQIATRFVCTKECSVSDKYKEAYLNCKPEDIVVILSPTGMPARVIKNRFVDRIQSGEKMKFKCPYRCLRPCDPYSANYCIAHALLQSAAGNLEEGFAMCGANAHRVKNILSTQDLVDELANGALKHLNSP